MEPVKLKQKKDFVFVCSPYRGKLKEYGELRRIQSFKNMFVGMDANLCLFNTQIAKIICRELSLSEYVPIAPHLIFTQFLQETVAERGLGIKLGLKLMKKCNYVLVVENFGVSEGMGIEINFAQKKRMEIIKYEGEFNGKPYKIDTCGEKER
jgi:hypothetical protein